MKKIIAMIKPGAPLFYFVNQVNRCHPVDIVIVEDKRIGKLSLQKKIKSKFALGAVELKHSQAAVRVKNRAMADLYQRYFGADWACLDKSLRIVFCENINDPAIAQLLSDESPDLLLDHGTSIVKNNILEKAPLALNLHWGLSPYYRGTHCTEWALINWDPYNIGVTIHRLTKAIDGGDVLGQARLQIEDDDTVNSINMKLTLAGTEIIIDAVNDWMQGHEFKFLKQDSSQGCLTLNRQWSKPLKQEIKRIERRQVIRQMLKYPARTEKRAIVEYVLKSTSNNSA